MQKLVLLSNIKNKGRKGIRTSLSMQNVSSIDDLSVKKQKNFLVKLHSFLLALTY